MTDLRQAAQQALEALEGELLKMLDKPEDEQYRVKYAYLLTVITALRTALEQKQAEPVAWFDPVMKDVCCVAKGVDKPIRFTAPLYTIQPQRKPEQELKCSVIIEVFGKDWRLDYMSLPVGKHKLYTQQYTYTTPPQRPWVGLTDEDWEKVANRKNTAFDTFEQGATWAAYKLERRNK